MIYYNTSRLDMIQMPVYLYHGDFIFGMLVPFKICACEYVRKQGLVNKRGGVIV